MKRKKIKRTAIVYIKTSPPKKNQSSKKKIKVHKEIEKGLSKYFPKDTAVIFTDYPIEVSIYE